MLESPKLSVEDAVELWMPFVRVSHYHGGLKGLAALAGVSTEAIRLRCQTRLRRELKDRGETLSEGSNEKTA